MNVIKVMRKEVDRLFMKGAPKRKFSNKAIGELSDFVVYKAVLVTIAIFLNAHKDSPFESVDEIIGDMQLNYKNISNEMVKQFYKTNTGEISIEDVMKAFEKEIKKGSFK